MTAELLRRAASEMRARAEAEGTRGWMKVDFNEGDDPAYRPLWGVANDAFFNPPADEDEPWLAVEVHTGIEATADHIAGWHPTVALAVADWLEAEAAVAEVFRDAFDGTTEETEARYSHALTVARTYLGESA